MTTRKILSTALMLVVFCAFPLAFTGCDTPTIIQKAKRVINVANKVLPAFRENGVNTARAESIIKIGNRLITVLDQHDNAGALEQTSLLIAEFDAMIAEDVIKLPETTRRGALLVLVAGNIALQEIAAALEKEIGKNPTMATRSASRAARQASIVQEFAQRQPWRCRAAGQVPNPKKPDEPYGAGQYIPMALCKKYPNNTTVETK